MTSTNGTMLISEREVPVWRASCGIFVFFRQRSARPCYADKFNKDEKALNTENSEKTENTESAWECFLIFFFSVSSVLKIFALTFYVLDTSPALTWI